MSSEERERLRDELREVADGLADIQAAWLKDFRRAQADRTALGHTSLRPEQMKDTQGNSILAGMLAHRGQVLAALASLQEPEVETMSAELLESQVVCGATKPATGFEWECNLPYGHEGNHWGRRSGRYAWRDE